MRLFALILFVILLPIFILMAILITFSIREFFIFSQVRIGKNRKKFVLYKFKTMKNGKIFFIGKIFRKLGLDEIPQLINVIKNEMSIIGPRPLTMKDIKRLDWEQEKYDERWSVKPGITCLAQLSFICNAEHSMEKDLFYVRNKSLSLDIQILINTILVALLGKRTN